MHRYPKSSKYFKICFYSGGDGERMTQGMISFFFSCRIEKQNIEIFKIKIIVNVIVWWVMQMLMIVRGKKIMVIHLHVAVNYQFRLLNTLHNQSFNLFN